MLILCDFCAYIHCVELCSALALCAPSLRLMVLCAGAVIPGALSYLCFLWGFALHVLSDSALSLSVCFTYSVISPDAQPLFIVFCSLVLKHTLSV